MHATTQNDRKRTDFAVIRSYQSTRIERELLAHVFELASHGVANRCDDPGNRQRMGDHATAEHDLATPNTGYCRHAPACQLDRVA